MSGAQRTVLALASTCAILLGAGLLFFFAQRAHLRAVAAADLEAIGELKAAEIAEWRSERLGDATVLMRSPFLNDAVTDWLTGEPLPAAQVRSVEAGLKERFLSLRAAYGYADVLLVDDSGRVRLSLTGDTAPLDQEAASTVAAALRSLTPQLTDLHRGPGDPAPHIAAVAPLSVASANGERAVGAVLLRMNAQRYLYPLIQSWPVDSATAETLLVERVGQEVVFLNDLRHRDDAALELRIPLVRTDVPAVPAALGREGLMQGPDYRGVEVLAVLTKVPDSPWSIVAKVDTAEALSVWSSDPALLVALVLGLVAVGASVAGLLWQRRQKATYRSLFEAQAARAASEARYGVTLRSIGDAVITTDTDGNVQLLNPVAEQLTGWTQTEAKGHPLSDVFHIVNEATGQEVETPVARVLREGVVVGLANHTVLIARGGEARPIADSGAPIRDDAGATVGVVLVFRDQTAERAAAAERQRAEEEIRSLNTDLERRVRERTAELQAANAELEAFSYSVSHDLRAPLRALDGFSDALLSDASLQIDHDSRHYLQRIRAAAERMGELIDDLLDLSRVSRRELVRQEVDLSSLAHEIITDLRGATPDREVDATVADGLRVEGDAHLLRIALQNLIDNAWKFTADRKPARVEMGVFEGRGAPSGAVTGGAAMQSDDLADDGAAARTSRVFFVRDNGVGFDMTYAKKLFAPFQRLHPQDEFPGTGIGLATVQRIIVRHGGSVWIEAAPDRGATVYFSLGGDDV